MSQRPPSAAKSSPPVGSRQQHRKQVPALISVPRNRSSASSPRKSTTSSSSLSSSPSACPFAKWTIPPAGLPPPPVWMERSTLACHDQPQQVLDNIVAFLRPSIVECHYNQCNKIDCSLACSLRFVIYLWKDNDNDGNGDEPNKKGIVWVELQRREGCAIGFHRIKQRLFLSLLPQKTGNIQYDELVPLDWDNICLLPTSSWLQSQAKIVDNENKENLTECRRLLRDNPTTGMEQLLFIVENQPTSSEQLMRGPCREYFRELMSESLLPSSPLCLRHEHNTSRRRRLALHILATLLAQLAKQAAVKAATATMRPRPPNQRKKSLIDLEDLFWERTVLCLRDCVHNAACHPQEAALAIQCLRNLYVLTPSAETTLSSLDDLLFRDEGFLEDLQRALLLGRTHHQPLATEAWRLVEYYGEATM